MTYYNEHDPFAATIQHTQTKERETMLFNLINPSDPYTLEAEDLSTAAMAACLLSTTFGVESTYGSQSAMFLFMTEADLNGWFREHAGVDTATFVEEHRMAVADALASFVYGDVADRKLYNETMDLLSDEEAKLAFKDNWQDRISSLSNIGKAAWQRADEIREACK